jgi:tRNA 2-thiouridine synthesizing protein A
MSEISVQLNARRLLCPLPVIRTQDAITKMNQGELLVVTSTDPGAKHDIPIWCRINGHEVIEIKEENHEIIITIKVNKN